MENLSLKTVYCRLGNYSSPYAAEKIPLLGGKLDILDSILMHNFLISL